MLIIDIVKIELIAGHIANKLIIEMAKIELIGGHIGLMLIIEMAKIEINRRPYWIYARYRNGQNRN